MNMFKEALKNRRDFLKKRITNNSLKIDELQDQINQDIALIALIDNQTSEKDDFSLIQIYIDMKSKEDYDTPDQTLDI